VNEWLVAVRRAEDAETASTEVAGPRSFVIEESLGYLVNRTARAMAGELAERLRPAGIGIGQWAVMLLLWAKDGSTQAEIARFAAIEAPTVVRTIDRMVRDGIVTREADPRDARLARIHLTERGLRLRDELVPAAIAVNEAFAQRLTEGEAAILRGTLRKLLGIPSEPESSGLAQSRP
jgi:DNA-binding MarR family transcriptional regulator